MRKNSQQKTRGGAREGSGRPAGEATATVGFRIAKTLKERIDAASAERKRLGLQSLNQEFIKWVSKKV